MSTWVTLPRIISSPVGFFSFDSPLPKAGSVSTQAPIVPATASKSAITQTSGTLSVSSFPAIKVASASCSASSCSASASSTVFNGAVAQTSGTTLFASSFPAIKVVAIDPSSSSSCSTAKSNTLANQVEDFKQAIAWVQQVKTRAKQEAQSSDPSVRVRAQTILSINDKGLVYAYKKANAHYTYYYKYLRGEELQFSLREMKYKEKINRYLATKKTPETYQKVQELRGKLSRVWSEKMVFQMKNFQPIIEKELPELGLGVHSLILNLFFP